MSPDIPPEEPAQAAAEERSVLVLLSGGLDSTVALCLADRLFAEVTGVCFDYGQRSRIELERARAIARTVGVELVEVRLDLAAWGGSRLFGDEPVGVVRNTAYVPARNLILLSLAAGIAEARDIDAVWIGTNASERDYPDQSPEFVHRMQRVFDVGLRRSNEGRPLRLGTPLAAVEKHAVVRIGMNLGAPIGLSWSCYQDGPDPCGVCGACEQRQEAFATAGCEDPARARQGMAAEGAPARLRR